MGESAGHLEVERTFDVPRRWSLPALEGVGRVARVGAAKRMTQTATYLDTPGLDLIRSRRTLRRRTGGTDAGWTLKAPAEGEGRHEFTEPLGSDPAGTARIPARLRAAADDEIGRRPLVPVAILRTRRTRRPLEDESGAVLALVEDDAVEATVLVDGERIHRWREVEVELVDGTPEDLDAISAALVASGLSVSDAPSKLGRALGDVLAAEPGEPTAGEVVVAFLARQLGVLQSCDRGVREDRPDAVHKARVATRRLRSTLKSFRGLFDRSVTDPLREEIAWLTGVLGEPRDLEVLRERFTTAFEEIEPSLLRGGARERILRALDRDHEKAHARAVRALDSRRYGRLLASLVDLVVDPPLRGEADAPAQDVLPGLVAKASKKVLAVARKARAATDPAQREELLHDVRKKAKQARYAAEAAGDVSGVKAGKIVSAWTDLQEALGEHQDSVVARAFLETQYRAARRAGDDTFTYGVLVEREAAAAREVESHYEELLDAAWKAAKKIA